MIETFDRSWERLRDLGDIPRQQLIDLVPIRYDHVWDDYRQSFADAAAGVHSLVPQAKIRDALQPLVNAGDDDPGFIWDSIFDVLLYRYAGDLYRYAHTEVMLQVTRAVQRAWDERGNYDTTFSFVCHSLGTAVTHGALNRLAGGPIDGSEAFCLGGQFQVRAYVTVANVSRVLWYGEHDLYRSTLIRPTTPTLGTGYVNQFVNVRHVADPAPSYSRRISSAPSPAAWDTAATRSSGHAGDRPWAAPSPGRFSPEGRGSTTKCAPPSIGSPLAPDARSLPLGCGTGDEGTRELRRFLPATRGLHLRGVARNHLQA